MSEVVVRKQLLGILFKYGLLPGTSLLVLYFMMRDSNGFKRFQRRIFAWIYHYFSSKRFRKVLDPIKQELFLSLNGLQSKVPGLASNGQLRILEIGVGDGSNLKFYPKGTLLTSVEPNPYFEKMFETNSLDFPGIVIDRFITGSAEDMRDVPSSSIDVVVSTHVLCSVESVEDCLREITRVLVPEGKFYYLEHIAYQSSRASYLLQLIVEPFWKLFSDGCRLTQSPDKITNYVGLRSEKNDQIFVSGLFRVMRPHLIGISVKT